MNNVREISQKEYFRENAGTDWLSIKDLRAIFNVGDTKARKMMAVLPSVRIGKTQYVLLSDLKKYLKDNNGIKIHWT